MAQATTLEPRLAVYDGRRSDGYVRWLFTVTSFLGSFLLFLIQPMAARILLPEVGGSSALWSTALAFFQIALLAGYIFAHYSTTLLDPKRHRVAQGAVVALPLVVLPVALPEGWHPPVDVPPSAWVLFALLIMVGLPFFALSTASPTLQRWLSWTDHPDSADPYFLYSAGNVGSVLALVGYPVVIEPRLDLDEQGLLWATVYGLFVVATLGCALVIRPDRSRPQAAVQPLPGPVPGRFRWFLLSASAAALLVAITQVLSVDIAPFPLLWVVPLLLYLLTFVFAFRRGGPPSTRVLRPLALALSPFVAVFVIPGVAVALPLWLVVSVILMWFAAVVQVLHIQLVESKPPPSQLTVFFVAISTGGAVGGTAVSLVAPAVVSFELEIPLALFLAVLLLVKPRNPLIEGLGPVVPYLLMALPLLVAPFVGLSWIVALILAPAIIGLVFLGRSAVLPGLVLALAFVAVAVSPGDILFRDRSFYASYSVVETDVRRSIVSGRTNHGDQLLATPRDPVTYYARQSPISDLLDPQGGPESIPDNVGIVGLGAGGISAYGVPGQTITYFEIDSLVVDIAQDEMLFTYLRDSAADVRIEIGDGRQMIERSSDRFDLLVIDAFNSDAIPVHLLTVEAMRTYVDRLEPDGRLAIHVTNRFLDLAPVVAASAESADLEVLTRNFSPNDEQEAAGANGSIWMVIAPERTSIDGLRDLGWIDPPGGGDVWTDDFSNVFGAIQWSGFDPADRQG